MLYLGVATVNNKKYLEMLIDSIQTKYYYELLIVDNGSEGDTRDWVTNSGYEAILNPTNFGVSKAWNQIIHWGMSFVDAKLIMILNNDIILEPNALDNLMDSILNYGYLGISGINIGRTPDMLKTYTPPIDRYIPNMNFSCFGLTPGCIRRIGLFDEGFKLAYFEDNDYHHRMNLDDLENACDRWAAFTHFGSRSIKEGGVKHEPYFTQNREYFKLKWGFLP